MKKIAVLLLLSLVVVGVAFAKPILKVQAVPYALEGFKFNTEAKATKTQYGFGGNIGVSFPIKESNFLYGIELDAKNYKLENNEVLKELSLYGQLSWRKELANKDNALFADLGIGVSYEGFSETGFKAILPSFGIKLGFDKVLDKYTKVNASIDGYASRLNYGDSRITMFKTSVSVGVTYLY